MRPARGIRECNLRTTFYRTGDAALALAGNRVSVGGIEIGEKKIARETCFERAELYSYRSPERCVGDFLDRFASGNTGFEDFCVVQGIPDLFPGGFNQSLAG